MLWPWQPSGRTAKRASGPACPPRPVRSGRPGTKSRRGSDVTRTPSSCRITPTFRWVAAMSDPSLADLGPGWLAFGPIGGAVGFGVGVGQILTAPWKQQLTWKRWWRIRHTGVVVTGSEGRPPGSLWKGQTYETGVITAPELVQAEPGGVQLVEMRQDRYWNGRWV